MKVKMGTGKQVEETVPGYRAQIQRQQILQGCNFYGTKPTTPLMEKEPELGTWHKGKLEKVEMDGEPSRRQTEIATSVKQDGR